MLQFVLAEHPFFAVTGALYAAAASFYAAAWVSTKRLVGQIGTAMLCAALVLNAGLVAERWIEAQRAPFKSLFESLVFFALNLAVVYVAFEKLYRTRAMGLLASLLMFGVMAYALSKWDAEIVKLPPALQSAWFIPHVMVYFVGYAAVGLAALVAAAQLVSSYRGQEGKLAGLKAGSVLSGEALDLEKMTYELIRFGFVLLTIGLLIGSVWAKSAWGDFWVWDPKENWSLVTWLVYGAYLHLRKVRGWRGNRAAWLAVLGFAVVMFTYLGMKYLPTAEASAHVYSGE